MVNVMPCITPYLTQTKEGNRNENLFRASNHIYFNNKRLSAKTLMNTTVNLNKNLDDPLPRSEIRNIVEHITKHSYSSSCKHFQDYCKQCIWGNNKLPYNQVANRWQYLDRNNCLKSFYGFRNAIPKDCDVHPWDIIDTNKLSGEDKKKVWKFRRDKGWNIKVDVLLKRQGILIDDEALEDFLNYSRN